MSEKGYEPDIERRRVNVAEVPTTDIVTDLLMAPTRDQAASQGSRYLAVPGEIGE